MSDNFIETLVPSRKLRPIYILILSPCVSIWFLPLSTYNIPLPSTELESWFLDKLLMTLFLLTLLYTLSTYLLRHEKEKEIQKLKSEVDTLNNKITSQSSEINNLKKSNKALDVALNGKKMEEKIRASLIPKQFS